VDASAEPAAVAAGTVLDAYHQCEAELREAYARQCARGGRAGARMTLKDRLGA